MAERESWEDFGDEDEFEAGKLSSAALLNEISGGGGAGEAVPDSWDAESDEDADDSSAADGPKQKFAQTSTKKQAGKKKVAAAEKLERLTAAAAAPPAALRSYEERKADEMRAREVELNDIRATFGDFDPGDPGDSSAAPGGNRTADADDLFGGGGGDDAVGDDGSIQLDKFVPRSERDFERLSAYLIERCDAFKEIDGYAGFVRGLVRGLLDGCAFEDVDAVSSTVQALAN